VKSVTIKLGLQIPNFSYGTGVAELFPTVIAQAQEADAAGFDSVFVMDHFYQLPGLGTPDQPMLEAYTALGGLATATEHVQLGTLVTGNTYRNPTLLAKAITTLDVISQGRAILGLGTGWFELEHDQLGYEFGTFTDRFNKLYEALEIIVPMIKGERPTFSGKYYKTVEAMANPRFRDHIPLMIGGSGEKKTIPLAARQFDHLNVISTFDKLADKVAVKNRVCEDQHARHRDGRRERHRRHHPRRHEGPDGRRKRRAGGRADQDQRARRGNRRRDHQHADQRAGLPTRTDHGIGQGGESGTGGLNTL
jgi:F420-dependent oxidoreductase-like protein